MEDEIRINEKMVTEILDEYLPMQKKWEKKFQDKEICFTVFTTTIFKMLKTHKNKKDVIIFIGQVFSSAIQEYERILDEEERK